MCQHRRSEVRRREQPALLGGSRAELPLPPREARDRTPQEFPFSPLSDPLDGDDQLAGLAGAAQRAEVRAAARATGEVGHDQAPASSQLCDPRQEGRLGPERDRGELAAAVGRERRVGRQRGARPRVGRPAWDLPREQARKEQLGDRFGAPASSCPAADLTPDGERKQSEGARAGVRVEGGRDARPLRRVEEELVRAVGALARGEDPNRPSPGGKLALAAGQEHDQRRGGREGLRGGRPRHGADPEDQQPQREQPHVRACAMWGTPGGGGAWMEHPLRIAGGRVEVAGGGVRGAREASGG